MSNGRLTATGVGAGTGAATGAMAGMGAGGIGAPAGAAIGGVIGGASSFFSYSGGEDEARAKQAAKDRWLARRKALAAALSENYSKQGMEAQKGLTSQMQSMSDGQSLRDAAALPTYTVDPSAAIIGGDQRQIASSAKMAAREAGDTNIDMNVIDAKRRDAQFQRSMGKQATLANAGVRFNTPAYERLRFLNQLEQSQADADFQRDYGDVPNSAYNKQLLGSALSSLGPLAFKYAARSGGAPAASGSGYDFSSDSSSNYE